ncbi:MAG TPA: hypothetical protein V6D29_24000 [Leptolyngbyaceae cyanobacterium]
MGLIKNIFGAIFGVIGGVFGAIAGILGIGKKSEFFLELDESKGEAPAIEPVKTETAKSADKVVPAAIEKGATVKPAAATKKPEPAKPAAAPVAAPAPATAAFASEYLVNPSLSNNSRRRPGPSLSPFLDLARQVKAPAK